MSSSCSESSSSCTLSSDTSTSAASEDNQLQVVSKSKGKDSQLLTPHEALAELGSLRSRTDGWLSNILLGAEEAILKQLLLELQQSSKKRLPSLHVDQKPASKKHKKEGVSSQQQPAAEESTHTQPARTQSAPAAPSIEATQALGTNVVTEQTRTKQSKKDKTEHTAGKERKSSKEKKSSKESKHGVSNGSKRRMSKEATAVVEKEFLASVAEDRSVDYDMLQKKLSGYSRRQLMNKISTFRCAARLLRNPEATSPQVIANLGASDKANASSLSHEFNDSSEQAEGANNHSHENGTVQDAVQIQPRPQSNRSVEEAQVHNDSIVQQGEQLTVHQQLNGNKTAESTEHRGAEPPNRGQLNHLHCAGQQAQSQQSQQQGEAEQGQAQLPQQPCIVKSERQTIQLGIVADTEPAIVPPPPPSPPSSPPSSPPRFTEDRGQPTDADAAQHTATRTGYRSMTATGNDRQAHRPHGRQPAHMARGTYDTQLPDNSRHNRHTPARPHKAGYDHRHDGRFQRPHTNKRNWRDSNPIPPHPLQQDQRPRQWQPSRHSQQSYGTVEQPTPLRQRVQETLAAAPGHKGTVLDVVEELLTEKPYDKSDPELLKRDVAKVLAANPEFVSTRAFKSSNNKRVEYELDRQLVSNLDFRGRKLRL